MGPKAIHPADTLEVDWGRNWSGEMEVEVDFLLGLLLEGMEVVAAIYIDPNAVAAICFWILGFKLKSLNLNTFSERLSTSQCFHLGRRSFIKQNQWQFSSVFFPHSDGKLRTTLPGMDGERLTSRGRRGIRVAWRLCCLETKAVIELHGDLGFDNG